MTDVRVGYCSRQAATFAVRYWHYSATMPAGKLVTVGCWEDGAFVGAIIYGRGNAPHLGDAFDLDHTELCELTRVAFRDHASPLSAALAESLRLLHRASPKLRLVLSFADPDHGHHGGLYQAANWYYLGPTAARTQYRTPDGRLLNNRVVSPDGYKRQFGRRVPVPRTGDCTPVHAPPKHRYGYPLDKAMRRRLAARAEPYPKPEAAR